MRGSGILLPVSGLPSKYGIGTLGKEAYGFVDFLEKAGQTYWQILPLGPTGYGDSPYQSFSAFACNPYYIDIDRLKKLALLTEEEIRNSGMNESPGTIDYANLYHTRLALLQKAAARLDPQERGYIAFVADNAGWLESYALFMALKAERNMDPLWKWPKTLRLADKAKIEMERIKLRDEVEFWRRAQYLFSIQWKKLKEYANKKGIKIIGDIPIYVSADSAELWMEPELFQTDDSMKVCDVAGCPPDAFSKNGQLWGNPLYDWEYHKETGFEWWLRRFRHAGSLYDIVRFDHFRGLSGYYSIPAAHKTARQGCWKEGPGSCFIKAIKEEIPGVGIIAEDLGFLTDDVKALLAESGFPGMKVLQFAFDSRERSDYLPHNYDRNSVVYTGTHDNTTIKGWETSAPEEDVSFAREYMGISPEDDMPRAFIRLAMGSVSDTCIIPAQDWLGLGEEARMNIPSTTSGNWKWRLKKGMLTDALAAEIHRSTDIYGRLQNK